MPAVRCSSRINTFDLKVQMEKRLGSEKADKYFNLLTRYLNQNLRKTEFNKLCISLIGRENLNLHNELIISILKNAIVSKIPPPKQAKAPNGTHPRTSLHYAFPKSPKKGRTPNLRERKFNNRSVSIRVHEKIHNLEDQSATELLSLGSKPPVELNSVEDGEEVEQDAISPGVYSRSPVRAPLGINIHSKETRKVLSTGSDVAYYTETCHYSGQLLDSNSLKNRLKHNLKTEGLDISTDCVNLLNNGLDSFLKRVIKPSLDLGRSRSLQRAGTSFSTSMLDFRVASEMNPKILGEDYWDIQLEKNC